MGDRLIPRKVAWQCSLVLTFLLLFWTLAALSPVTDKTHRSAMIIGEALLTAMWAVSSIVAFGRRPPIRFDPRSLIRDHPQLWIAAAYFAASLWDLRVIPMCDNGAYFKSILDAVQRFDFVPGEGLQAMKLFGHPAYAYAATMMLGQFMAFADFAVANLQARILEVVGILAFAGIVGHLFPGEGRRLERLLLTALFTFFPLVYGVSLTISPDHAVLVFFCLTIYCYLEGYAILTVASGLMLCFSKEAGALLYASLCLGLFAALLPFRSRQAPPPRRLTYLRSIGESAYLGIPALLFVLYLALDGQLWKFKSLQDLLQGPLTSSGLDASTVYDKTVQLFLANFNWLVWGLIAAGVALALYRWVRRRFRVAAWTERDVWLVVLGISLLPFLMINYKYVTWNNARYIVPVSLVEVILLGRGLESLWLNSRTRLGTLAVCLVILGASSFRTFDPLLNRLFPTFWLGDHRMSFYNSQITLCDLTLYNREYVYLNRLFDRFLHETGMDPQRDKLVFFAANYLADHNITYLWTGQEWTGTIYVDPHSGTRTYDPRGTLPLQALVFSGTNVAESSLPAHAYTVSLFWRRGLETYSESNLERYYRIVRTIRVEEDGYWLEGFELALKSGP
jgi:hypothetical protein